MSDQIFDIILNRMDKMEEKLDLLLSKHYMRVGISIAASFLFSVLFGVIVALIERH